MDKKIINYLNKQIKEVKDIIKERDKLLNCNNDTNKLFSINDYQFYDDPEDNTNYNYDLGRLITLQEIKFFINKKNNVHV